MRFSGFLNPSSVAIYGASERTGSPAAYVLRNLLGQGYSGTVAAINPKHDTVAGQPCHPSQAAAKVAADLAVIAIPPALVPAAFEDCAAVGTKNAIVISAGFGEGQGPAGFSRLIKTAGAAGIRFIGPNCLGIIRPQVRLNATFQAAMPPVGGLALISQSGAICSGLADMAETEGLGFSFMMSLGNSIDFGMADALEMATADESTKVILAYVEGVRDGTRFRAALTAACRCKPVIVLKAGRHAQGAAAATTHTGALIGSDRVFSAVLRECGAVQVATLGEMIETARLLSAAPNLAQGRLAVVTNGGGIGVLSADRLADRGLRPADLPGELVESLDQVLNANWSRRNPIDIVGDAGTADYAAAIDACLGNDAFDALLVLLSPQSMTVPERVADTVLAAHHRSPKPIMTCFLGGPSVASARAKLQRLGVADFRLPEHAVQAFAQALQAERTKLSLPAHARQQPERQGGGDRRIAAVSSLGPLPAGTLGDAVSRRILSLAGLPCPVPKFAETADQAVGLFREIGGPVVLKIASPDVSHKSDVDGVRLNLQTSDQVTAAFQSILETTRALRPEARIDGVTVEPMIVLPDARELLIGVTQDAVFGPVLTFGAGGTLVEVIGDVSSSLLPLTLERARQLIAGTKVARLLGPFRNRKPVDVEALAGLLVKVSDLALDLPNLAEMDINPLLASPQGFCAVDARIRIAAPDRTHRMAGAN